MMCAPLLLEDILWGFFFVVLELIIEVLELQGFVSASLCVQSLLSGSAVNC